MKLIKYIKYGGLIFIGLLGIVSCKKSLDLAPAIELESNYFDSEYKIQTGIVAAYAKELDLHGGYMSDGGPFMPAWALPADDITYEDASQQLETFSGLNSGDQRIGMLWNLYYQEVARCNFMLDKLNEPQIQALYKTPGLMNSNRGELLFLRSWVDYRLWDWFRKAPIQSERILDITGAYLEPSTGFAMLDSAIVSLEKAAPLLPETWPSDQLGRITKDGAYGLLVKCYTLRACYNNKNVEDYGKAIAAFEKISASRQLVIPFGNNFDYRTENNSESLYEVQATQLANGADNPWLRNDDQGSSAATGIYYNNWNGHWSNYTSGICGPTKKLINAFEKGDPRKKETIRDTADNLGGSLWWISSTWSRFNKFQMVKYVNGARGNCYEQTWQILSANNCRLMRLADIKLLAAEAYLATGNTDEALKQVNDIRERARKSTPDGVEAAVPAALSAVTMTNIMNERFLELAGEEGIRWTDLRRWHAAGYIDLGAWTSVDFGFPYNKALFAFDVTKHLLYPIPSSEMNSNPKMQASGNNPGY
jgi:starch-binding outer membrane protein, SusD/RagB family